MPDLPARPELDAPSVWTTCRRCHQLVHLTAARCASCGRPVAATGPSADDPDATAAMDLTLIDGLIDGLVDERDPVDAADPPRWAPQAATDLERDAAARLIASLATPAGRSGEPPTEPPTASPTPPAGSPGRTSQARSVRLPSVRVTVIAALAAVVAGSAVLVWRGPAQPTAVSASTAAAASSAPVPTSRLSVTASSVQTAEGGVSYDPANLLDGRPDTAWNSNGRKDGKGPGMALTFAFASPVDLRTITVRNGYQKVTKGSGDLFALNARVRALVVVTDGGRTTWQLADTKDPQTLKAALGRTSRVRFEVVSIYPGAKYLDLAISEVGFTAAV